MTIPEDARQLRDFGSMRDYLRIRWEEMQAERTAAHSLIEPPATRSQHDASFRAKVQEALDDPRPPFSEEEAEAHMEKLRSEALSKMK